MPTPIYVALDYATHPFRISKQLLLPCHNWCVQIVAVRNTAAHLRPNNHNPTWIRDLAHDSPEAKWKHKRIRNESLLMTQFLMPATQKLKLVL